LARSRLVAPPGAVGRRASTILLSFVLSGVSCSFPHFGFGGEGGGAGQGPNQEDCDNGKDDDEDGKIDCADSDCVCPPDKETDCHNGKDDDQDGKIDCADSDCVCPPDKETDCHNGKDDDQDGKIDCADSDCSCSVTQENCSNGKDDDKDGDVDCADTLDCVCAPAVPEGWDGPAVIWHGAPDLEPTCSDAGAYRIGVQELGHHLSEPAWACPECRCGDPEGATCSARITYFSEKDCTGSCWPLGGDCGYDVGSTCEAKTLNYGGVDDTRPVSAGIELSATSIGSCPSETVSPVEPSEPSWDEVLLACVGAPVGGLGCDAAHVCVPRPPPDPFDRICVYADGAGVCPPSYEAFQATAYGDYDDSRGCTECGCAAPTGIQCTGTVTDYDSRVRCGGNATVIGAGECLEIPPQSEGSEDFRHTLFKDSSSGGTCTPTGGEKTGSIELVEPVTFCCVGL
jgi:hypothetical protein